MGCRPEGLREVEEACIESVCVGLKKHTQTHTHTHTLHLACLSGPLAEALLLEHGGLEA